VAPPPSRKDHPPAKASQRARSAVSSGSPSAQLSGFLARYAPEVGAVARAALARMRKRLPGAIQLVYDNYNALVIAFGPTERPSELILSIALYPRWVTLFFAHGAELPDPEKLLKGSGTTFRHVVLASAGDLDAPGVRSLVDRAVERSAPWDPTRRSRLVIRSVSAKQRPRRPA
jgi:hypothetical protein